MAQSFTSSLGTQITPGAIAGFNVVNNPSGLGTTGVLMIVGEADAGPDYTVEVTSSAGLSGNFFGPDSVDQIAAKYKSGPIVDLARAAAHPMNDPNIIGSPSRLIIVKTNPSGKATALVKNWAAGTYGTLADKSFGVLGNNINYGVTAAVSEVVPTTGNFTYIPPVAALDANFRVSGGAALALTVAAAQIPSAFVSAVAGLSGVTATGGANRSVLPSISGNLALAVVSGNNVSISYTGTLATAPLAGDTLVIPAGSVLAGAGNASVGAYVVTSGSVTTISATKLSDANKPGAVAGTITPPVAVTSTPVAATTDIADYAPVSISVAAANPTDGLGKTLEISELISNTDRLSRYAFVLGTTTPVTWVSTVAVPTDLVSASEYRATLVAQRAADNTSDTVTAGGDIALRISYKGATATLTVGAVALTTAVTGGAGANLNLALSGFPTINDLVAAINSQTGYAALVGSAAYGALPVTVLDQGTFGICTTQGAYNGRIKADAYRFFNALSSAVLVQLGVPPARAAAGIPAPTATNAFLTGGTRGATTQAVFNAAIDALQKVKGNFVVPAFSNDATVDIANGLTDSGSTYQILSIHAYVRSHVLAMSVPKRKRARQACLSIRDTYVNAKAAAAALNAFRTTMSFQDQKVQGADGTLRQLPPYICGGIAAGGQSAAFYRNLTLKYKNISGAVQAAGDWDPNDPTLVDDAIQSGLLVTVQNDNGSWQYASDQTTYQTDNNFVFNSMQMIYTADIVSLGTAAAMQNEYGGASVGDVTAQMALTTLEGILDGYRELKLLAPSSDAPAGYKNAKVKIIGPAMLVSAEIKLAGAIYFIPITFTITQVTQTATQ